MSADDLIRDFQSLIQRISVQNSWQHEPPCLDLQPELTTMYWRCFEHLCSSDLDRLKSVDECCSKHRLHRAAPEMYRILKEMYFDPETPAKAWYFLILGIIEDVEGVDK